MTILSNIREQIKVILRTVPDIGFVHDYDRLAMDTQKLLTLFTDANGMINGVSFRRTKMAKRVITIGGNKERVHIFLIRVIMGLQDSKGTGILFDDRLAAIEEAFDANKTLNDTCLTIAPEWGPLSGVAGVQIDISEDRMFANTLCHYAELYLGVVERLSR